VWLFDAAYYEPPGAWHWNGESLSWVPAPGGLWDIFEVAPGDVWAVGSQPCPTSCGLALYHVEAGQFVRTGSPTDPRNVAGSGADDVRVAGIDGATRRPDGTPASVGASWPTFWEMWGEAGVGTFALDQRGMIAQRLRR
jgi:hypothetical protein